MSSAAAAIILLFVVVTLSPIKFVSNDTITPPTPEINNSTVATDTYTEKDENPNLSNTIKKYIRTQNKKISQEDVENITKNIIKYSSINKLDPGLLTGLIRYESNFNKRDVSSSGAMGLGQLMPPTAKIVGVSDPYDIEQAIMGCSKYLRRMMDRWKGNNRQIELSLASYKDGYGATSRSGGRFSNQTQRYITAIMKVMNTI